MGKPIVEAEFDVQRRRALLRVYGGMASKIHGETLEVPDNALSMVVREPVGVVEHREDGVGSVRAGSRLRGACGRRAHGDVNLVHAVDAVRAGSAP